MAKIEALRDIVTVLRRPTHERQFSMHSWACGTTACAIGEWLLSDLRPDNIKFEPRRVGMAFVVFPEYGGKGGFDALAHWFGLPQEHVQFLFHGTAYIRSGRGLSRLEDPVPECVRRDLGATMDDVGSVPYGRISGVTREMVARRVEVYIAYLERQEAVQPVARKEVA